MSAIAGRVLQIHKGAYDAATAYSPLDEVLYQGSTYVCKQNSTGNLPTNTTYWQLVAQKGDAGEIQWSDNAILGAKNLAVWKNMPDHLKYKIARTNAQGITSLRNDDYSLTLSGTATANTWIIPSRKVYEVPVGTRLRLTGCPEGGNGSSTYKVYLTDVDNNDAIIATDTGDGAEFTYNGHELKLNIQVFNGYAFPSGGKVFKPMVSLADDTETDFQSPAMGNKELTDNATIEISNCNSNGQMWAYKRDGMVTMSFSGDSVLNADGMTLGTVPSNFLPLFSMSFATKVFNGSTYTDAQINVDTSTGVVKLASLYGQKIDGAKPANIRTIPLYMVKRP